MKAIDDSFVNAPKQPQVRGRRLLAGLAIAFFLALIFVAYLRPGFALDLMNRFVLCF